MESKTFNTILIKKFDAIIMHHADKNEMAAKELRKKFIKLIDKWIISKNFADELQQSKVEIAKDFHKLADNLIGMECFSQNSTQSSVAGQDEKHNISGNSSNISFSSPYICSTPTEEKSSDLNMDEDLFSSQAFGTLMKQSNKLVTNVKSEKHEISSSKKAKKVEKFKPKQTTEKALDEAMNISITEESDKVEGKSEEKFKTIN